MKVIFQLSITQGKKWVLLSITLQLLDVQRRKGALLSIKWERKGDIIYSKYSRNERIVLYKHHHKWNLSHQRNIQQRSSPMKSTWLAKIFISDNPTICGIVELSCCKSYIVTLLCLVYHKPHYIVVYIFLFPINQNFLSVFENFQCGYYFQKSKIKIKIGAYFFYVVFKNGYLHF